jgi:hypothetical protein
MRLSAADTNDTNATIRHVVNRIRDVVIDILLGHRV